MSNTVLSIESLDLSAQGVAHDDEGKVVFVEGALPGEKVRVEFSRHKKNYNKAQVVEVLQASPLRVTPRCPYFGQCGEIGRASCRERGESAGGAECGRSEAGLGESREGLEDMPSR